MDLLYSDGINFETNFDHDMNAEFMAYNFLCLVCDNSLDNLDEYLEHWKTDHLEMLNN